METIIDVCIYFIIFGGAFLIVYGLVRAIFRVANKIRRSDADERIHQNRAEYRAGWRRSNGSHDS